MIKPTTGYFANEWNNKDNNKIHNIQGIRRNQGYEKVKLHIANIQTDFSNLLAGPYIAS